jgi:hypothetical protein
VLVSAAAVRYYTIPTVYRYVFYVDIPPPLETEAGDRDLTQYDFGGHVENCEQKEENESCFATREQARKFIEDHFKNRRRGYVIIDGASLDLASTAHFFIEPGTSSEIDPWEIRVRVPMPGPYTRFHRNMNTIYYMEVFRRRAGVGELNIKPGTSALVLRSRGVYELLL